MAGKTHTSDPKLIRTYCTEMTRQNLSDGTLNRRRQILERITEQIGLATATPEQIQRFLDDRDIGPRTRYHWISHLSAFYSWAVIEGFIDSDPTIRIQRPKLPRLLPRPIGSDDLGRALSSSTGVMHSWLLLASYGGFRCAEIARLNVEDINFGERLIRVHGKGDRERLVPMHPLIAEDLRSRSLPRSGPVFRRVRGTRFPAAMVSREISVFLASLEIPATAHALRHWFGTAAYQNCKDLRVVQELLGHASVTATTLYTQWSFDSGRAAVDSLLPPAASSV